MPNVIKGSIAFLPSEARPSRAPANDDKEFIIPEMLSILDKEDVPSDAFSALFPISLKISAAALILLK